MSLYWNDFYNQGTGLYGSQVGTGDITVGNIFCDYAINQIADATLLIGDTTLTTKVGKSSNGTTYINGNVYIPSNLTIGSNWLNIHPSDYAITSTIGFQFKGFNTAEIDIRETRTVFNQSNVFIQGNINPYLEISRDDIGQKTVRFNSNGIYPKYTDYEISGNLGGGAYNLNIHSFHRVNIASNLYFYNLAPNLPCLLSASGNLITGNIPASFISNIGDSFVSKTGDTMTGTLTSPALDVKGNSLAPNPFGGYILLRPNTGGNNVIYGDGNRPFVIDGQTATNPFHIDGFSSINLNKPTVIKNFLTTDYIDSRTNFMDIGTSSASTLNIGHPSATINFQGNVINFYGNTFYSNITNHNIADKDIQLNANSVGSGTCRGAGLLFRDNGIDQKGYIITNTNDGRGFWFVAPEQTNSLITELRTDSFTGGLSDYPLLQSHYDGSTTKIEPSPIQVSNITTLETNVATKVSKSGDTMTGTLEMNNTSISIKKNTALPNPFGGYIQFTPNVSGNNKIYNDGAHMDIDGQTNNANLTIKGFQFVNIENRVVSNANIDLNGINSLVNCDSVNVFHLRGRSGLSFIDGATWRFNGNTQIQGTLALNGTNPRISGNITNQLILDANVNMINLTASKPLSLDSSKNIISGDLSQSVITGLTSSLAGKLSLTGGTMTGSIALSQQIISNCIQVGTDDLITGLSGIITLSSNLKADPAVFYECTELPTLNTHLTKKEYVDDEINTVFSNVLAGNHTFTGVNTFTKDTTFNANVVCENIHARTSSVYLNAKTVITPKIPSPCIILYSDETTPSNANPTSVSQDGFTISQLKNGTAGQGVYLQSWNSRDLFLNSLGNNIRIGSPNTGISILHYGGSATFYNNSSTGQYYQLNYNTHYTDGSNIAIDGQTSSFSYSIRNYSAYNVGASWTITSDRREKRDIEILNAIEAVNIIRKLKPCSFSYNTNPKKHIGFIAQDVETVLPSAVSEIEYDEYPDVKRPDDKCDESNGLKKACCRLKEKCKTKTMKSLDYNSIFTYQTSVIQYLLDEVEKLKTLVSKIVH